MLESVDAMRDRIEHLRNDRLLVPSECKVLHKIADEIEAEVSEKCMELPLDADGVPIRVGDKMASTVQRNWKPMVDAVFHDGFFTKNNGCQYLNSVHFSHVKPRTVENVLDDFYHAVGGNVTFEEWNEVVARFAAELQMKEES